MFPPELPAGNPPPERIRRFLAAHRDHFSLALLIINRQESRRDFLTWLTGECRQSDTPLTTISAAGLAPGQWLERLSQANGRSGVFVLSDLDDALGRPDTSLATAINRQRERIAHWLRGPVLLILGDLAFDRLLIDAPDLADWHAAVLRWEETPPTRPEPSRSEIDFTSQSRLPVNLIEGTIRLMREQLQSALLPEIRARMLAELASGLSEVGQRTEALSAINQAVVLYRELATAEPEAFRPNLAMSLSNQAARLSEVGQRTEALSAINQAVDIRRELAAAQPEAYRRDLASALHNRAALLSEVGQRTEALSASNEAVDIRRELAAAHPEAFRPDLAMSLNNQAALLSAVGQRTEALSAINQAADLYRELAATEPEAFRPALAMSLNTQANRLSEVGQRAEALVAINQAVDIRRELAAAQPEAFRPVLAGSLNNQANLLSAVGQRAEALVAINQAVDLYRELAAAQPDRFAPDLANSCGAWGQILVAGGQFQEATEVFTQGLSALLPLLQTQPEAVGLLFARLLAKWNHAGRELGLPRSEQPEELFQQFLASVAPAPSNN